MPSPVGHALGGLIAGGLVAGRPSHRESGATASAWPGIWPALTQSRHLWRFAVLGIAADVDLLFRAHSSYTHSVGAVIIVMLVTGVASMRSAGRRRTPVSPAAVLASGAAYASHLLLDWLGTDTSWPFGIMALWPFATEFYKAPVSWFPPVSREISTAAFWIGVPVAVVTELAMLGPIAYLVARVRPIPRDGRDGQ